MSERKTIASDGTRCPSGIHCTVYEKLLEQQRLGIVSNIRKEVKIHVCGHLHWHVDYVVFDNERGCDVAHEAKGFNSERFETIMQAWNGHGPMNVVIWRGHWSSPFVQKIVRGKK